MPLTTYDEVRPWARAIKDQILTRRMPQWFAAHGYGAIFDHTLPRVRGQDIARAPDPVGGLGGER